MTEKVHSFTERIEHIPLPEKFTCPFHYTPHPLCVMAAQEVQHYLQKQTDWHPELRKGKMFGVLIVRDIDGTIGFLAAFSGLLDGRNIHSYFVPPIYDLQHPDGFFQNEESEISNINHTIDTLEGDLRYSEYKRALREQQQAAAVAIEAARLQMQKDKAARAQKRRQNLTQEEESLLIRESQYQKAELKRLKQQYTRQIADIQSCINQWQEKINLLKEERKRRSAALQQKLFAQFKIRNYLGETQDLCEIFKNTDSHVPPAGAGECAAPRLLQYAFIHGLHPIAMAEFWWGDSPASELRRHGYYYPACKSKCEPILLYMLQGLNVEENRLLAPVALQPEIVWEDPWIVIVNKPAGMLSVPGKSGLPSVTQWLQRRYPESAGPMLVHRLDMATSGLLLAAKTQEVHKLLQVQFKHRQIQKRYIALLDGMVSSNEGTIDLPICLEPDDRPRQTVNFQYGKTAITRYQVITREAEITRIAFYPITGRTHQLRVHAAHPLGLNLPIKGDELYGKRDKRLYLHAEAIEFQHPVTNKKIHIEKKADF